MGKQLDILIVDDEEVMRSLFTDLLSGRGHKVSTVADGKKAVELVKKNFFHIAFIDVHMPVISGVETLSLIKKISPDTSVVMTDSFPDTLDKEALKEVIITCIRKPFNIQEVIEIVDKIIEEKDKAQ